MTLDNSTCKSDVADLFKKGYNVFHEDKNKIEKEVLASPCLLSAVGVATDPEAGRSKAYKIRHVYSLSGDGANACNKEIIVRCRCSVSLCQFKIILRSFSLTLNKKGRSV
jgi:hypothetical protein